MVEALAVDALGVALVDLARFAGRGHARHGGAVPRGTAITRGIQFTVDGAQLASNWSRGCYSQVNASIEDNMGLQQQHS